MGGETGGVGQGEEGEARGASCDWATINLRASKKKAIKSRQTAHQSSPHTQAPLNATAWLGMGHCCYCCCCHCCCCPARETKAGSELDAIALRADVIGLSGRSAETQAAILDRHTHTHTHKYRRTIAGTQLNCFLLRAREN